jgi:flavin reductase (DIM6/NTAB) family NADH-FMN oxidoreductase RutF
MASIVLPVDRPIWDRFFTVSPLVVVGTRQHDGSYDLAPKHMAMPVGWQNYYGFVCSPRHATYHNVRRERQFTVSFPSPSQVAESSLAAGPRCEDDTKPSLSLLSTSPASIVDGRLVDQAYLHLECTLHSIVDGFGDNSLIVGQVVAAAVDERCLRDHEQDDGAQLHAQPLLAYISPGRYTEVRATARFPFPKGYSR